MLPTSLHIEGLPTKLHIECCLPSSTSNDAYPTPHRGLPYPPPYWMFPIPLHIKCCLPNSILNVSYPTLHWMFAYPTPYWTLTPAIWTSSPYRKKAAKLSSDTPRQTRANTRSPLTFSLAHLPTMPPIRLPHPLPTTSVSPVNYTPLISISILNSIWFFVRKIFIMSVYIPPRDTKFEYYILANTWLKQIRRVKETIST